MAFKIPKVGEELAFACVLANNQRQLDSVASLFHKDRTSVTSGQYPDFVRTNVSITSADATDSATLVTLSNELKLDYNKHAADAIAHKVADTANVVTNANATDTATAITLLNELKGDYNTHRASTTFHYTADSTNAIAAANATDLATAITLANEAKTDINAHMGSAPAGAYIEFA